MFLVAVEYEIDDGYLTHGVGDALLFDGDTSLYVLECKSLTTVEGRNVRPAKRAVRMEELSQQTAKYVHRIRSWVRHLSCDPLLTSLSRLRLYGISLTDDGAKMEQPGIEPGSS